MMKNAARCCCGSPILREINFPGSCIELICISVPRPEARVSERCAFCGRFNFMYTKTIYFYVQEFKCRRINHPADKTTAHAHFFIFKYMPGHAETLQLIRPFTLGKVHYLLTLRNDTRQREISSRGKTNTYRAETLIAL
jgi:hypothetical protein